MSSAQSQPEASSDAPEQDLSGTTLETETEDETLPGAGVEAPAEAGEPAEAAARDEPGEATADGGEVADEAAEAEDEIQEPRPYVNPLVELLRTELAERDEQLRSYITAYKEATADMERERERMARHRETVLDRERMELAGRLLPVLDNLDRSLAGCVAGADLADVAEGLRLVRDGFFGALGEMGVEQIDALGAIFDANLHEATAMIPAMGKQSDQEIVFEELPGYTFRGRLLRATRVVVASKPD